MRKIISILMFFNLLFVLCACRHPSAELQLPAGSPSEPPPSVSVTIGGVTPPCHGGAGWTRYTMENGMTCVVSSSRVHPLDIEHKLFKTNVGKAELHFTEPPTGFSVYAWPIFPEGEPHDDVESITLTLQENSFALLEGNYVYEIAAHWEFAQKDAECHRSFNAVYTP